MIAILRAYLACRLGSIGSIIGILSGVNSMTGGHIFGGGGTQGGSGSPTPYVPTGRGAADTQWQNALQQISQMTGMNINELTPIFQNSLSQMMGIPTGGLTQAGQAAGAYSGSLASQADAIHNLMNAQAGTNLQEQNQLLQAGVMPFLNALDPQKQLYKQMYQQVQDQSRAGTSARGIGMSPQAAGLENQATSNFQMDWQNQQLQRELAGLSGMDAAFRQAGIAGNDASKNWAGSLDVAGAIPGLLMQQGTLPFGAAQMAAEWPMQAANMFSQGMQGLTNPDLAMMQQIIPYLNYGLGASNSMFNQNQTGLNNLTTGLTQLGQGGNPFASLMQMFNQPYGVGAGGSINYGTTSGQGDQGGWPGDPTYGSG